MVSFTGSFFFSAFAFFVTGFCFFSFPSGFSLTFFCLTPAFFSELAESSSVTGSSFSASANFVELSLVSASFDSSSVVFFIPSLSGSFSFLSNFFPEFIITFSLSPFSRADFSSPGCDSGSPFISLVPVFAAGSGVLLPARSFPSFCFFSEELSGN